MNSSVRSEGVDSSVVSSRHVFRGIEYVITIMIDSDKEIFVLEVEDRLTSDQWRGQFDARCKLRVKRGLISFPYWLNLFQPEDNTALLQ